MSNTYLLNLNQSMRFLANSFLIGLLISCGIQGWLIPVQAQSAVSSKTAQKKLSSTLQFIDMAPLGGPPENRGGGSRGSCLPKVKYEKLFALLPTSGIGMTKNSKAMVWFYLPESFKDSHGIEIVMEGETNGGKRSEELHTSKLKSVKQVSGVVGVELPVNAPKLTVERKYTFRISVHCNDPQSMNLRQFWVKTSLQRVARGKGKTWHDALIRIGQQRCQDKGRQTEWANLLNMAGYKEITQAPVTCLKASANQ